VQQDPQTHNTESHHEVVTHMASRRSGHLGKGLGALIPEMLGSPGVLEVPIESIEPNPRQPRTVVPPAQLEELAASIAEHGVLQPLVVQRLDTPHGAAYRLIAGERRWRAARQAGMATVPVVIKEVTDQQLLELALIENIQRQDLNALEEASAYRQLVEEFGLTQESVASRVGKARVTVANALRLLHAPPALQQALLDGVVTEGHVRALLGSDAPDLQLALLEQITTRYLSVRQTEEMVRRANQQRTPKTEHVQPVERSYVEEHLERTLGTKVTLKRSRRGGTVTIYFYSEEELDGLLNRFEQ